MKTKPDFLSLPEHHFDYSFLMHALRRYHARRNKVGLMLRNREIIRVRKGLYIRSPEYGGTIHPLELANGLYGPSYVSLEYALARYGLIPERVITITSVTSGRKRRFDTPVGSFSYEHIPLRAYAAGIQLVQEREETFMIASKEKALCDMLYLKSPVRTLKDLREYLVDNLRIDEAELAALDLSEIEEIGASYVSARVKLLPRIVKDTRKDHAHS
jgi:hypothetical protein